jgi:biopolymer transport protein ExbB
LQRIGILAFLFLAVTLAVASTAVVGQDAEATGTVGETLKWVDHFVVKGGWITWFVLLPLSVATIALVVEHAVSIRRTTVLAPDAQQKVAEMLTEKQYVDAVRFTSDEPSVVGYAMNTALLQAGRGLVAMERALAEAIDDRAARLMRKIEYLNVIGNVSPMIGLFGTVYGMIRLFASIRAAGAIPEPAVIADDISVALVTTFWGLAVAIPALSAFAVFRNRIDVLMSEAALHCEKLMGIFKPGETQPGVAPATRPVQPVTTAR